MRAWQGAVGVSMFRGIISPAYVVVRPREDQNSRYFHYLLRTPAFATEAERWSYGISSDQWNLRPEEFKQIYCCIPPLHEQSAIVRYLDCVDRRIRRYIQAKKKLIALLNEQKQVIIHRAVTRGLNPNVRLKPSDVEWLGDVPEHGGVKKLRLLFCYVKGRRAAELTSEYIGRNVGDYPVYSGQTEANGLMGTIDWYEFNFEDPVIFVTTVGARAMSTKLVNGPFCLSQNCALIIPRNQGAKPQYFELVLQRLFTHEKSSISLIMQPSLRFTDLSRFYVPCPPVEEQTAIAEEIRWQLSDVGKLEYRARLEIDLFREYRTRLIADIVTGKLDVREAAARLPDEPEELEPIDEADELKDAEEDSEVVEELEDSCYAH
jgi:type I restriction enzyme S subunit